MGGAPPPRLAAAKLSHFLPQCNPNFTFSPTSLSEGPKFAPKARSSAPFIACARARQAGAIAQRSVQPRPVQGWLQQDGDLRTSPAPKYDRRPAADPARERNAHLPLLNSPTHTVKAASGRRIGRTRAPWAVMLIVLAAGLLAACGSSHKTGAGADPASAVPASAPLYAGAVVRPEGELKTAAQQAGKGLTHQADPYLRLLELLRTPGSPPLDFSRDLAPWLGPQAAAFASSLTGSGTVLAPLEQLLLGGTTTAAFPFSTHGAQGAIVLDTTDAGKAKAFLESQARLAGAHDASYRGTSYEVNASGIAFGVVDGFAVIGSESGLRAVIDTSHGAPALVHSANYSKLLGVAPSDTLAHVYSDPGTGTGAPTSGSGTAQAPAGILALLAGARPVNVSIVPSATSITLDADALPPTTPTASGGLIASSAQGAPVLDELPGDSWLAVGLGDVGPALSTDVQGLADVALLGSGAPGSEEGGGITVKGLLEGVVAPLSILGAETPEAKRDFQSWMGSAGVFASGTGLVELRAAVTITSKNPSLSRAAVGKLGAALSKSGASVGPVSIPGTDAAISVRTPGFPVELAIANGKASDGQTKLVLGLAEASVTAALSPSSTLASAPVRTSASAALGEGIQPSLIVSVPTFLSLLEGVGLSEDPAISKVLPYLRSATTVAGGAKSLGGEVQRLRLVVGLQPTS